MTKRLLHYEKISLQIPKKIPTVERQLLAADQKTVSIAKITYRSMDGVSVTGYIVKPKRHQGRLPCLIFNRGGYEAFGKISPYLLLSWLTAMAKWGYVVIASQYRGVNGGKSKDEFGGKDVQDVLALKDVLGELEYTNISRIGMVGISRGGMMTYLALTQVRWIRSAVIIGGPTNLERNVRLRPELRDVMKEAFGGSRVKMRARSAIYLVKKLCKKTPLLILHGSHDWRVNPLDALDFSQKLLEINHPHRLVLYEKTGHALTEVEKEAWLEIQSWFRRFV